MESDKIISLQQERIHRIAHACQIRDDLWQRMLDYTNRVLNLRDKVRAKHLFCQRLDLEPNQLLEPFWQVHMTAWMALEYRNIYNDRVIDLFMKEYRNEISESEWVILGQFMATYISVYEVQVRAGEVCLTDYFSEERYVVVTSGLECPSCLFSWLEDVEQESTLMVGRLLKLGSVYGMLEPCHMVKHISWDVERRIHSGYKHYQNENPIASWRSYMQYTGINILSGCVGSYTNTDHSGLKWRRKND